MADLWVSPEGSVFYLHPLPHRIFYRLWAQDKPQIERMETSSYRDKTMLLLNLICVTPEVNRTTAMTVS